MRSRSLVPVAAALATSILLTAAPTAYADDIVNDVDATIDATVESVTIAAGSTRVVTMRVVEANGDGKNGCNLTGSTTATFSVNSSNTSFATVSPSSIQFTSCGDTKNVTVTAIGAGTTVISLTSGTNTTAGSFNVAPATFQAVVTSPCTTTAPAAPVITASAADAITGWYNAASGPASFTVSPASDAEYSLNGGGAWTAYPASTGVVFSTDGIRSVTARRFVPAAGSCARVDGTPSSATQLKVDRTAPTYSIEVSPAPNAAGWNNSTVGVTYTCGDAGSGLASSCPSVESWGNGTSLLETSTTISDLAGNASAPATRRAIKVDTVKPTVTASVPAAYNAEGFNQPFALAYTCGDDNSGVTSCPADESFTEAGSPYAARTVTVTDAADNVSDDFDRRAVLIDATKPSASVVVSPNANGAGWNNTTTTATYTCADNTGGSGLSTLCPTTEEFSDDGDYAARDFSVTDNAGNVSDTATRRRVQLDTHAPSVEVTVVDGAGQVVTPVNGFYTQAVTIHFTCSDPTFGGVSSGVQTGTGYACPADVPVSAEGRTSGGGYEVRDVAGNATTGTTPTISIDTIAPTLSVIVTPADANGAGWNNVPVDVNWTCSDLGSGIDPATACPADVTVENGQSTDAASVSVSDLAGNSTGPVSVRAIQVDTAAPSVSVTLRAAALGAVITPNANEWFRQNVYVDFECSDTGGSGLVTGGFSCPADYSVGNGTHAAVPGAVHDVADNSTAYNVPAVNVDTVRPVIAVTSAATAISAGGSTWFRDVVTVTFTATDALSGLAAADAAPFIRTANGDRSDIVVGSATGGSIADLAGNVADDVNAGPYKVDGSAPTVSAAIASTPAYLDFYRDSVAITATAADPALADATPGSGLATDPSGTVTRTTTGTYAATAEDHVGHSTTSNTVSFKVDGTAPVVTLDCRALPSAINKGDAVTLPWSAVDEEGGSGLAGAASGTISLNTATIGAKTGQVAAAAATDNVGHPSPASNACAYNVTYRWTGFFQPIDALANHSNGKDSAVVAGTIFNKAKAGSSIPVKFSLGGDQGQAIFEAGFPRAQSVSCSSAALTDDIEEYGTSVTSGLKYDATAGHYIYTWKTPTTTGCQRLQVKLADGTSHYAFFNFTK